MRRNKTIKLMVIALASLVSLTSCGRTNTSPSNTENSGNPSNTENSGNTPSGKVNEAAPLDLSGVDWNKFKTAKPDAEKTKVVFWNTVGDRNKDDLNLIVNSFNAAFPGIKVEWAQKGGYDELFTNVKNAIPAGTTPTMAYCYPDHVATYLNSNLAVENMTPFMDNEVEGFGKDEEAFKYTDADGVIHDNKTSKEDMISGYLQEGQSYYISGKKFNGYYSLPFSRSSEIMFYNKTILQRNGIDASTLTSWDKIWDAAKKIKENDANFKNAKVDGKTAVVGYDSDANLFITMSEQLGIPYTDGSAQIPFTFYTQGRAAGKKLLTTLKGYYDKGYLTTQTTLGGYTSTGFTEGKVAFTISSTAGTNYVFPSDPSVVGVLPLPTSANNWTDNGAALPESAKKSAVISQGPSVCFFRRASLDEKCAAWLFYKYATGSYWNAYWAGKTSYEPVRNSSYEDAIYKRLTTVSDTDSADVKVKKEVTKQVHDSVKAYGAANRIYTSDVFVGSSTARNAVNVLVPGVFQDANFAAAPDAELERLYKTAYYTAAMGLPNTNN